ncbi:MAG: porphobilinogen synthase [Gammaproteobacteria bacterium]
MNFPTTRLRRLRQKPSIRHLIAETTLSLNDFVLPLFIRHGEGIKNPISSMPGHYQLSVDNIEKEIKEIKSLGLSSIMLFGIPEKKDGSGTDSYSKSGIIQTALRTIKNIDKELLVMTDVCFCEYTDHGHCGELGEDQEVDNDKTLLLLAKQAVSHAQAGSDVIVPSGMMDGKVSAIRTALDAAGFQHLPILSHSAKYSSSFYGAFREATECAPQFGDRKTYQMDPANSNEALREVALDIDEGADMVMVKPALSYLDVIYRVKQAFPGVPVAGYHVSGEFSMIKAAAANGWLDEKKVTLEAMLSIKRAGANFIVNYHCKDLARWL